MPKDHDNATILIQEIAKQLQELDTKVRNGIKTIPMAYRQQYDHVLGKIVNIVKEELAELQQANKDHQEVKYDRDFQAGYINYLNQ
jgi:phage terminase Nu1 subunit (DNA packaging protein)